VLPFQKTLEILLLVTGVNRHSVIIFYFHSRLTVNLL